MKTILYNPIFINPQAYYVFPRLTRYLQPDNESTSEPANYIGTIEVKVIAYGDTTLKRTYTNTDSIDLSEFKNTWIRISLFTKVGSCVLGEWKIGNMESDLPYIDPEVLASLKAVVIVGNKTNNDSDRAIVKNLVDPDNPFVISNAAYEGMSGYNGYPVVFGANKTWAKESNGYVTSITSNTIHITNVLNAGLSLLYSYVKYNGNLQNIKEIPPFKIEIKGLEGRSKFIYKYLATSDATKETNLYLENGTHELPKSFLPTEALINNAVVGFSISPIEEGVTNFLSNITIKVLPEYEGAFVTDRIDDLITSTKTVQEMLGGSTEFTAVSMVHLISSGQDVDGNAYTNYIRTSDNYWTSNRVSNVGKTGIYGYSFKQGTPTVINNILGDKNDYTTEKSDIVSDSSVSDLFRAKFSVEGFEHVINGAVHVSSVAWYWTIIANKVLTTDQINQVIAYFNLDRTLKSDIYCNIAKQGITNENHAEFGDKLIDFSGNGRDIQLNNIAWKGDSGIGKYEVDFASLNYNNTTSVFTATYKSCSISKIIKDGVGNIFYNWGQTLAAINSTKIQVIGLDEIGAILEFTYLDESGNSTTKQYSTDGIYDLPASAAYQGDSHNTNFRFSIRGYIGDCDITITQIPSHAGALCLDGINDFGKVTGMPIYKDYTFIIDYERISYASSEKWAAGVVSKSHVANQGAFILMTANTKVEPGKQAYSFGGVTSFNRDDFTRALLYQSKYKCGDVDLTVGEGVDSDTLWLGAFRDNDQRFFNGAIYSLMTFPYSMSEFLIERQLKKHKLGTLYPDMVEWRPIIKSNVEYASISYLLRIPGQGTVTPVIGQYYPILSTDTSLVVYVATNGVDEVANLTINGQEPTSSSIHVDGRFKFEFPFNNSPQKINITIDEYIRYEDIVQPYPSFVKLENLDRTYTYTWGDKLKVGDTIRYNSSVNLLEGAYTLKGQLECNGVYVYDNNQYITVAKEMIFAWTNSPIWSIDDNEPKCILSPRLLRIPNSSYKILGYIPDISGHGNHGKINNSAYAEGSGVNEDGSYQFDGVDDFITIPTTVGGKQVLMKVNWQSIAGTAILYDQRTNGGFAIFNRDFDTNENKVPAYRARNIGGSTYIDGILNKYIYASELKNITHNIVELHDPKLNIGTLNPKIGSSYLNSNYTQMSLYDFMLFDEISTDDKIKELNKYVGIEGNTEWRKTK